MKQSNNKISIPQQEAIQFPKDVQIGKYYMVPCIALSPSHTLYSAITKYIPINSHLHEDSKIIGFPHLHWHIDWRFVNREVLIRNKDYNTDVYAARYEAGQPLHYGTNSIAELSTKIHYHKLKCKRSYSTGLVVDNAASLFRADAWMFKIGKHFCNSKLKEKDGQLICPHKGAIIDKNCTDASGNYVCPAHMLRFNPVTLQVVTDPEKEETNFDNFLNKKNA